MPNLLHEQALAARFGPVVAGIDEAGRGPWAGPVTAAAVVLPANPAADLTAAIRDSKQLSAKARAAIAEQVMAVARVGVGFASVAEIDTLNILQASHRAMARAMARLGGPVDAALVDGRQMPRLACPVQALVGGDRLSLSVAAASIIAKVRRDAVMVALDAQFPGYGWAANKGYGTAAHRAALARLGVTPEHRRSFRPIREGLASGLKWNLGSNPEDADSQSFFLTRSHS